jgi:uncharacterized phage-associated protein
MMQRTHYRFREDKATQAAARLLRLRGGRMSHMKLIKLMYLVERESLIRLGLPLTYDTYASLPHGPVLSATLDRISSGEFYRGGYWDRHITPKSNHAVSLRDPAGVPGDQLSPAEEALIDEVFQKYGHLPRWKLVDLTHELPEWTDPHGSSLPIEPADILRNEGWSEEAIAELEAEWEELAHAQTLFG